MAGAGIECSGALLGEDTADNSGSTANVTANVDGSILERLEDIIQQLRGGAASIATPTLLGIKVSRATADVITGVNVPIFNITGGKVLLKGLIGKVTTVIGAGASLAKFQFNPATGTTIDMCATTDIDSDEAGTLYSISGTAAVAMVRGESGSVPMMANAASGVVLDIGAIEFLGGTDRTGSIEFYMWYLPLETGATVAAA